DRVQSRNRQREALPLRLGKDEVPGRDVREEEVAALVGHGGLERRSAGGGGRQADRESGEPRLARIPNAVRVQVFELDSADGVGDQLVSEVEAGEVVVTENHEIAEVL